MHLQTSILAMSLFAGLGSAGTLVSMINPKNHTECVIQSIGNQGCGSHDDPAYSAPWGYSKNGKTCEPIEDADKYVLASVPICGDLSSDISKWTAYIYIIPSYQPGKGYTMVESLSYHDMNKKDHNEPMWCALPSAGFGLGTSCTLASPTPSASVTPSARAV
ncbi:uncharacterized protein N7459_001162 [Penicillium hispanicum]|uniref:uncharacterized protein n=1 Tax=Penicillium hispanicum TaxID=1080232 RepID=UPI00253F9147|nr:uncharacterized protein N7459_001162 [Penicillium hispanicum]KAJ5594954.1 hypothetical protein N7459_001162 [Penicillium hispanicum]